MTKDIEKNGGFVKDGKEYVLLEQEAFQSDPIPGADNDILDNYYSAKAISSEDVVDEDGCLPCYLVRWEILPDYDPEKTGEEYACDWDVPSKVTRLGDYDLETGRILY